MNGELYNEIISDYLIPFACAEYGIRNFVLHQDNDPKHTSRLCSNFLKLNNIKWIKAPSKSPDLNPIEWLWNDMKTWIRNQEPMPSTIGEMVWLVNIYQKNLTKEKCQNYINHLKKPKKK